MQSKQNSTNSLGIDKGLSVTLNKMLLSELPRTKAILEEAYNSADQQVLRKEIHRFLGGMAYCNFTELHNLTLQFQASLKTDKSNMDRDFQAMLAEIDRIINTGHT
jgi:HPt (histidine-containing phosphotransfer) domain-containing protein